MQDKRSANIRHIRQNDLAQIHPADQVAPFGNNKAMSFIYKKVEKLTIAIHLVTNTVPENEPVRTRLRNITLAFLSDILVLKDGFRAGGPERTNSLLALLVEIISLLEVANASGYLSTMNLGVLRQECVRLGQFIREVEDTADAETLVFEEGYFEAGSFKGQNMEGMSYTGNESAKMRTRASYERQSARESGEPKGGKRHTPSLRHQGRQAEILKLIREKGHISVKDIVDVIDDCSEKTLQRELLMLVKRGVLKKKGERRWSTYTLAQES